MWFIKDFFINLFLDIRLWFYIKFKPSRFKSVINEIEKEGWELTFNDEFDQGKIDKKKWRTDAYYGLRFHPGNIIENGTAPDMYYGDNMFEFEGSVMKQKADNNPITIDYVDWDGKDWGKYTIPYRVGQIDNSNSFEQKYGYFEIRSKITDQPGHWPAFWLASKYAWPPEIDIYEIWTSQRNGKRSTNTIHWSESSDPHKQYGYGFWTPNLSDDYHVWGCEWDEKWIKIYFDGIMVNIYPTPSSFIHPMHIIINNGIDHDGGSGVPKDKDMESDITTKYVDYVKSYKKI